MDRLDCPLKGKIHPLNQTKILLGKQSQTFFHQAAEKITWSGRPKYPPEKQTQKVPRQAGKIFPETEKPLLKQKNLSLNRKTSP